MSETIPPEPDQSVASGISNGRVVLREGALTEPAKLLQNRKEKLDALRRGIQIGLDDVEAGRVSLLNVEDIRKRGQLRLLLEQKGRQDFS